VDPINKVDFQLKTWGFEEVTPSGDLAREGLVDDIGVRTADKHRGVLDLLVL
jgi:hypothetical protein